MRTGGGTGAPRARWGRRGLVIGGLVALGLTAAMLGYAMGSDGDDVNRSATTTDPSPAPDDTSPPTTPTSEAPAPTGHDLGTVRVVGASSSCPLAECLDIEVDCPEVPTAVATLAVEPAAGSARGVVVLFSGGLGNSFWASPESRRQANVVGDLSAAGLEVVEIAWSGDGWGAAPEGEAVGFARLACRSATITRWAHDERFSPLGLDHATGACGFCVSGNSGGASQVAYALAFYGLDTMIDAAVLTSGPPHADLASGCLRQPGDEPYAYGGVSMPSIDGAYGHLDAPGPCADADTSFEAMWEADSVAIGGTDYRHESTRIEVLLGGRDRTVAPAHARLYVDRLLEEGSPMVHLQEIAEMEHEVLAEAASRDAVLAALLGTG